MIFNESYISDMTVLLEKAEIKKNKNKLDFSLITKDVKSKGKTAVLPIKKFLYNVYKQNPEQMASELPSINQLLRLTITVGVPMAINPLIGVFTLIVDKVLSDKATIKDINKYISYYEKQIEKTENQIDKSKNKDKDYLEAHLHDLKEGLSNLEDKKYKLEDDEDSIIKKVAGVETVEECFNIFVNEMNMLSESQSNELCEGILDEAVVDKIKAGPKMVGKMVKQKQDKMDKWFDDTLKTIQGESRNRNREEIVKNSVPKLSKMVKRAIVLGGTWAINPAIAAISAVTMVALSKNATEKEKKRVLSELKKELELVEEKIKDSDSNGDRKEKYELIRLRQKLTTDIDRIKKYI